MSREVEPISDHLRQRHPGLYAGVVQLYHVLTAHQLLSAPICRDDFYNLVNSIEMACCVHVGGTE